MEAALALACSAGTWLHPGRLRGVGLSEAGECKPRGVIEHFPNWAPPGATLTFTKATVTSPGRDEGHKSLDAASALSPLPVA